MSRFWMAAGCVTLLLEAIASSQTAPDLARKYPHHRIYEVQPGVQMRATFASNGEVCKMEVEQTHFVKGGADLRGGLDEQSIGDLIESLVPRSDRGAEDTHDPNNGMVLGVGQVTEHVRSYANVWVTVLSSHGTTVLVIEWRHRTCQP